MATPGAGPKSNSSPKEAQVVQAVLRDMGVTEYEPAVINQLLDFSYRYVTDVLDDAKAFSSHANKKAVDVEDTKLAVQLLLDRNYTTPPPRELLLDISQHKNSQTLPLIKPYTGPKLPADRHCLSSMNYKLRASKKPPARLQMTTGHSYTVPMQRMPISQQKTSLLTQQSNTPSRSTVATTGSTITMANQALSTSLLDSSSCAPKRKLAEDDDYDV